MNPANKTTSKLHLASVTSKKIEGEICTLTFAIGDALMFLPGQYFWVVIPELENSTDTPDRMAFSVFDYSEDKKEITIFFRKGASRYKNLLWDIQIGSKVDLLGPFGTTLVFEKDYKNDLTFLAGGVGIAPLMAIIKHHTQSKSSTKIYLNLFMKDTPKSISGKLAEYKKENPNFDYEINNTPRESPPDKHLDRKICVVGKQGFVDHVFEYLRTRGIKKDDIIFEQNYPSSAWKRMNYDFYSKDDNIFESDKQNILAKYFIWIILIGMLFTATAGFLFYVRGLSYSIHIVTEVFLFVLALYWFATKNIRISSQLMVVVDMIIVFYIVAIHPSGEFVLYWISFVPVLSYIIVGSKVNIWNAVYLSFTYLYLLLVLFKIIPEKYDTVALLNSTLSVTMVCFLIYINSKIDNKGQVNLRNTFEKLNIFKQAIESTSDHIVITDNNGYILFANKSSQRITGFNLSDMNGNSPRLWGGEMHSSFYKKFWSSIIEGNNFDGEITNRKKNNSLYISMAHVSPIVVDGEILGYIGTEEDITKVKELGHLKDEFISIASHELRTPMTAINGFVSMIQDGDYGEIPDNFKDPLSSIKTSTERLIHLINDMLNVSRIEAGRMKIKLTNINPLEIMNEVLDSLAPIAKEKGIDLKVVGDNDMLIQADEDKLKEIFINLVGNSLKFTEKGKISLDAKKDGELVRFLVTDTGIGIPKSEHTRIFEKFEQVSTPALGKPKGTGLGLYISKILVEKMGGKMWVESSVPGSGSVFAFTLPISDTDKSKKVAAEINEEAREHPDQKDLAT